MGKRPKLENLEGLFEKGVRFELTDAQYEKKTGIPLPKGKSYIKNRSALSRFAADRGFGIEVIEKRVIFSKV